MIAVNVDELLERMDGSSYSDYCHLLVIVYWNI